MNLLTVHVSQMTRKDRFECWKQYYSLGNNSENYTNYFIQLEQNKLLNIFQDEEESARAKQIKEKISPTMTGPLTLINKNKNKIKEKIKK